MEDFKKLHLASIVTHQFPVVFWRKSKNKVIKKRFKDERSVIYSQEMYQEKSDERETDTLIN